MTDWVQSVDAAAVTGIGVGLGVGKGDVSDNTSALSAVSVFALRWLVNERDREVAFEGHKCLRAGGPLRKVRDQARALITADGRSVHVATLAPKQQLDKS
jgi:hypothetical protein